MDRSAVRQDDCFKVEALSLETGVHHAEDDALKQLFEAIQANEKPAMIDRTGRT
jgi:hypothetical protein